MELVFEMLNARQFVPTALCRKTFNTTGGAIGRGEGCDWVIPDRKRHLSNHHAMVSYHNGRFFLTDTSNNGILEGASGNRLPKGEPVPIEHGSVFVLGDFEVHARLSGEPVIFDGQAVARKAAVNIIPDEVFLDLEPLNSFKEQGSVRSEIDRLTSPGTVKNSPEQCADFARIDRENLIVPELITVPVASEPVPMVNALECQREGFWDDFAAALGVDIEALDLESREALALNAARLLKHSIEGLQQSLHTLSELKSELHLAVAPDNQKNPLKFASSAGEVLDLLLLGDNAGPLSDQQVVYSAFCDLQAHQVALVSACRASVRGALEHFSPQQLTLRFERDNWSLVSDFGSRWRAFGRYHQALRENDDWIERLLTGEFAQAYEEQTRLISTLHKYHQGC